ncbi:MAG: endonuclease NucS domain-containing protein [Candidatus Bathycorpusculaceae bacterium]
MVTISEAIKEIFTELDIVSAEEIIRIINQRYPNRWKESAIHAHLYGCSVNKPPAYTQHPSMPKFLFDHGRRRYELYNPEKHGKWSKGYPIGKEPSEELVEETRIEEEEVSFGLERDLEEYISRNLKQLEEGLTLYSAEGSSGRQYSTDVGRIDLLAVDKEGNFVVVELKAGLATDRVVGQVLGYMRYVRKNLAKEKDVRGIIVADDFDERLKYAVAEIPKLKLKKYLVKFEFRDIET